MKPHQRFDDAGPLSGLGGGVTTDPKRRRGLPPLAVPEAGDALQEAGFEVFGHVMKGTGHGIAPDGLGVVLSLIVIQFNIDLG